MSKMDEMTDDGIERVLREIADLEAQVERMSEALRVLRPTGGATIDSAGETEASVTYYEWLNMGIEHRWISEPFCMVHDDPPISETEDVIDLDDFCIVVARLGSPEECERDAKALADLVGIRLP